jgi:hypothetical protein
VFSTVLEGVVFHQEDSHADHRIQGPEVVRIRGLVALVALVGLMGLVDALSVAETEEQRMAANPRSWTGNCMPHHHSRGRPAGSPGYPCHRRYILRGSHLANSLQVMSRSAGQGCCTVAKAAASARAVAGGMTWRKLAEVYYTRCADAFSTPRGSFTVAQTVSVGRRMQGGSR